MAESLGNPERLLLGGLRVTDPRTTEDRFPGPRVAPMPHAPRRTALRCTSARPPPPPPYGIPMRVHDRYRSAQRRRAKQEPKGSSVTCHGRLSLQ